VRHFRAMCPRGGLHPQVHTLKLNNAPAIVCWYGVLAYWHIGILAYYHIGIARITHSLTHCSLQPLVVASSRLVSEHSTLACLSWSPELRGSSLQGLKSRVHCPELCLLTLHFHLNHCSLQAAPIHSVLCSVSHSHSVVRKAIAFSQDETAEQQQTHGAGQQPQCSRLP
jgi:hypothetical protein